MAEAKGATAALGDRLRPYNGVSVELQQQVEQFLYFEAELLDDRCFRDWYNLLTDDIRYWMPIRTNRLARELGAETSSPGMLATLDEDKRSMGWRVSQLESGMHWAEDPPSRTRHLVSNVRVRHAEVDGELAVRSNFICYRNRLAAEVDIWAGERVDTLRPTSDDSFEIAARTILLDQSVILGNLSVFF